MFTFIVSESEINKNSSLYREPISKHFLISVEGKINHFTSKGGWIETGEC